MLFGVEINARWTEWQQAVRIFAEIENSLFGVEGALLGAINRFRHN